MPLILHLFQRHDARRLAFSGTPLPPTDRKGARTYDPASTVAAAPSPDGRDPVAGPSRRPARFLRGGGGVHDPTAAVIVLDNSMSSGLIRGGDRVLDLLKSVALKSVDGASDEDLVWLIRAGQPWGRGGYRISRGVAERNRRHGGDRTPAGISWRPSTGPRCWRRGPNCRPREIHLISDMQASAFFGCASERGRSGHPRGGLRRTRPDSPERAPRQLAHRRRTSAFGEPAHPPLGAAFGPGP